MRDVTSLIDQTSRTVSATQARIAPYGPHASLSLCQTHPLLHLAGEVLKIPIVVRMVDWMNGVMEVVSKKI